MLSGSVALMFEVPRTTVVRSLTDSLFVEITGASLTLVKVPIVTVEAALLKSPSLTTRL